MLDEQDALIADITLKSQEIETGKFKTSVAIRIDHAQQQLDAGRIGDIKKCTYDMFDRVRMEDIEIQSKCDSQLCTAFVPIALFRSSSFLFEVQPTEPNKMHLSYEAHLHKLIAEFRRTNLSKKSKWAQCDDAECKKSNGWHLIPAALPQSLVQLHFYCWFMDKPCRADPLKLEAEKKLQQQRKFEEMEHQCNALKRETENMKKKHEELLIQQQTTLDNCNALQNQVQQLRQGNDTLVEEKKVAETAATKWEQQYNDLAAKQKVSNDSAVNLDIPRILYSAEDQKNTKRGRSVEDEHRFDEIASPTKKIAGNDDNAGWSSADVASIGNILPHAHDEDLDFGADNDDDDNFNVDFASGNDDAMDNETEAATQQPSESPASATLANVFLSRMVIPNLTAQVRNPAVGQCPWCQYTFNLKADLLSDLSHLTQPERQMLKNHEKKQKHSCFFWGTRVTSVYKPTKNCNGHSLRYWVFNSIRHYNSIGPRSNKGENSNKQPIRLQDVETKDLLISKLGKMFPEKTDDLPNSRIVAKDIKPEGTYVCLYRFMKNGVSPCREADSMQWLRDIVLQIIQKIKLMIVKRVQSWPDSIDWSTIDKVRLVSDINICLFNYYYFWHASMFYLSSEMDFILPISDYAMTDMFHDYKGKTHTQSGIDIFIGNIKQNLFQHQPKPPIPTECLSDVERHLLPHTNRTSTKQYAWIEKEDGTFVLVPKHVTTSFPYWLYTYLVPFPVVRIIHGWSCGSVNCSESVTSLNFCCGCCRKVFCGQRHLAADNAKMTCTDCLRDRQKGPATI